MSPHNSVRPIRIFVVMVWIAYFLMLNHRIILLGPAARRNNNATTAIAEESTPSSLTGDDADYFSLCGRTLYSKDMPRVPTYNVQYGVPNWERSNLKNAILLDHRKEKIHGRTGNQIRGFFHAFDYARDHRGPLVMRTEGFPLETTLKKLYLGMDNHTELEGRLGILLYENIDEGHRSGMFVLGTRWARDYVSPHGDGEYTQFDTMQHRHYLIQQLYRMTGRWMELYPESAGTVDHCASYHAFFGDDSKRRADMPTVTGRYTIIHSRSFEGKSFLEEAHRHYGVDARASDT